MVFTFFIELFFVGSRLYRNTFSLQDPRMPAAIVYYVFCLSLLKGVFDVISLYSGTPGSGKSLHAIKTILDALRVGRPVITNFDLAFWKLPNQHLWYYLDNTHLDSPDELISLGDSLLARLPPRQAEREGAILVVLDEVQLLFNARSWALNDGRGWISYFTQHRKHQHEVILICQFKKMIDRQIRDNIEYEYIHRKLSNFGFKGFVLNLLLGGRCLLAVKMWSPINEKVGTEIIRVRKSLYSLYNTKRVFLRPSGSVQIAGRRIHRT